MDLLNPTHQRVERINTLREQWKQHGWCQIRSAFTSDYISALRLALPAIVPDSIGPQIPSIIVEKLWDPFNDYTPLWTWLNSDGLIWMSHLTNLSLASPKRHSLRIQPLYEQAVIRHKETHGVVLFLGIEEETVHVQGLDKETSIPLAANQMLLLDSRRVPSLIFTPRPPQTSAQFMVSTWLETTAS